MSEVLELQKKNQEAITALSKTVNALTERLARTPAGSNPNASEVFGLPNIRHGEDPMSSRGYSFIKMLGVLTGAIDRDQAKIEMDIHDRMHQCLHRNAGTADQYQYKGLGIVGAPGGKFLAPLATSFLHDQFVDRNFRHEIKSLVVAGSDGADLDHMRWIRQRQYKSLGYNVKTMSWLNELVGGGLVAPPEQGELIELLRNKEALVNAGARVVPLPPQGRIKYPRQTSASLTYWVGENSPIPASDIGTGDITLQAKKLAVLIKAPNELIRFASPAAEALMRDDMTKSLALGLDLAGLEGLGGDNQPLGLINFPNINTVASSSPGPNGDALVPQDIYRMIAVIEESNAEFEGWIMRPKTWYKYLQLRADAVAQGDSQGLFMFNAVREPGDGFKPQLAAYPVTKSTQVSQVQTKGTATNLTYIVGGMWSDMLIGMFGAIEFAATALGDTSFQNDQTWVRGILSADIQLRHQSAFCYMRNLQVNA